MISIFTPHLFTPLGKYNTSWSGNITLITDRNSPTKDIYFSCRYPADRLNEIYIDDSPDLIASTVNSGDFVVVIRTVPAAFLKALSGIAQKLAGVAWFFDDDIPGAWRDASLPSGYGRRLTGSYLKIRRHLKQLCSHIWVSTEWLSEKYSLPEQNVISPGFSSVGHSEPELRYFYHGTKSHLKEMQFLRPVIEDIQDRYDFARFEIFGDHEVYKMFRDIPGTKILHPMQWTKFRQYTESAQLDIGFAPVLDSLFNRARSHNKLLDISRCGAVGIYSEQHAHAHKIKALNAGIVVENNRDSWVQAFSELLTARREEMLVSAKSLIKDLEADSDISSLIM